MNAIRHAADPDDPLARALAPPPGETPQERAARLQEEEDAKRVNDEIDERIKQDRVAWRKHKSMFKLLLLGQSESGACPSPLLFDVFVPLVPRFSSLDEIPLVFLSV